MAQVDVHPAPVHPAFNIKPIIKNAWDSPSAKPTVAFDAAKHLAYSEDPKVLSMKDLGLPEDVGISPVAVSQPFPLFTEEAVGVMRSEIFAQEVWDNCLYSTEFAKCQLRGHCPR